LLLQVAGLFQGLPRIKLLEGYNGLLEVIELRFEVGTHLCIVVFRTRVVLPPIRFHPLLDLVVGFPLGLKLAEQLRFLPLAHRQEPVAAIDEGFQRYHHDDGIFHERFLFDFVHDVDAGLPAVTSSALWIL
jgi:hypothetical protein